LDDSALYEWGSGIDQAAERLIADSALQLEDVLDDRGVPAQVAALLGRCRLSVSKLQLRRCVPGKDAAARLLGTARR
jgi:hypothetical protein